MAKRFSIRLKELRENANLSQRSFAEKNSVSASTVFRIIYFFYDLDRFPRWYFHLLGPYIFLYRFVFTNPVVFLNPCLRIHFQTANQQRLNF